MSSQKSRTLRIERVFGATPEVVFDAWTSVEALRAWWPAGPGWDASFDNLDELLQALRP
jgi:uncharacterized protein YndB with AHSA1/START domain